MDKTKENDDQVKKYFVLLKQAQNEALISLIADGLKSELLASPLRVSQMLVEFLKKELIRGETTDFKRLKISEGVVPILNKVNVSNELFESKASGSLEKQAERFEKSGLVVNLSKPHFKQYSIEQISSSKFFAELIVKYQPLLASAETEEVIDANVTKQNTKLGIKNIVMGQFSNISSIKLSDMIDEKFLEDVDREEAPAINPNAQKTPLQELIQKLDQQTPNIFEHHSLKRQKGESPNAAQFAVMSPMLALALYQADQLLSLDWKKRQVAACQLRILLACPSFEYSLLCLEKTKYMQKDGFVLTRQQLCQTLLPRVIICMLKDNFSDYEGIKVLPPVRDECVKLLSVMTSEILIEVDKLLTLLPSIFVAVEKHQWHSKLNFFLLIKGIVLKSEKSLKQKVLEIFGQLLIVAIPTVEDEPKVAITELLMILLPTYLASFNSPKIPTKTMTMLLDNLSSNLEHADEVEASAIAVFNLVCKVFEMRSDYKCFANFKYRLNLQIFAAFNFHKLEAVRISYNSLILQALQAGSFTANEDLSLLMTLTIQSLAMESNPKLIDILITVLVQIIKCFSEEGYKEYLGYLMQDERLPSWMISVQPDFATFTFVELKTFQSIQQDYFQVVFRPANEIEWDTFYNQKTTNLSKAVACMLAQGTLSNMIFDCLQQRTQIWVSEQEVRTVLNSSMQQLMMILAQYIRQYSHDLNETIDQKYLQDLALKLLQSDETSVSINECWSLVHLLETLKLLIEHSTGECQSLAQYLLQCFQDLIETQVFRHIDHLFHNHIEHLNTIVSLQKSQQLSQLFYQFYGHYQTIIGYVQEYSLRLKASASGVVLGIARLHMESKDAEQINFLKQSLNALIKPILCQINQERVTSLKYLACDSLADLIAVLNHLQITAPLKKVLQIVLQMESTNSQAVGYIISTLGKQFDNIYTNFGGFLGVKILKPQLENISEYLSLAKLFLQNCTYPQANKMFAKIAAQCFDCDSLPQFMILLFPQLSVDSQSELMLTLVEQMTIDKSAAFECLSALIDMQETQFIKFIPLFILPVIKSIQANAKRNMKILAKLIQILPLNISALESTQLPPHIADKIKEGVDFLKVFAENQLVDGYPIKIQIKAKLREYQLQGINWMAKLGQYNLNCILCDDMGLGKTLQALTVMLNESHGVKATHLVVCPSSLTYNWLSEINKFFTNVRAAVIEGQERHTILDNWENYDILIINYEKVKGNLEMLQKINFFYVVLDEAHKIKNSKSVVAQSVAKLQSKRKLALSGTPLQNRVSELWSLFDYIMPDFLEDEATFNKTYNKYLTGNIKKMQEKLEETQQFITALKSLKRRIAPFILRRTKEDVLKELPPKVIQDFECIMPPLQFEVHQIVERTSPFQSVIGKSSNSLQNLILHRKACNHPCLVEGLVDDLPSLQPGFLHSAKLIGLIEILTNCEIIEGIDEDKSLFATEVKQPHRALVFCQMQSFMHIVETDVLKHHNIKYLTLTGAMTAKQRLETVDMFNHSPQYKILLLTTSVGGLGLTLTGADVVIFVEHDWNPMKDLQAMDRAHRIGQTRTVNVYRLIVKDTIEEKIMSLQRFKENLAKSLVQARNPDEQLIDTSMDLNDLLKSFEEHSGFQQQPEKTAKQGKLTMAQVLQQNAIDSDVANLQKACEGTDFEKY